MISRILIKFEIFQQNFDFKHLFYFLKDKYWASLKITQIYLTSFY